MAKLEFAKKFKDNVIITLSDHLYVAIKRCREGMTISNPLLWDIKNFYEIEYDIGLRALELIKNKFHIQLPNDEAGFIALHIVNVELDEDNMDHIFQVTKVIQEIMTIVKYHFHAEFDTSNVYYYRFITHLKFFALRLLKDNQFNEDEELVLAASKRQLVKIQHHQEKVRIRQEGKEEGLKEGELLKAKENTLMLFKSKYPQEDILMLENLTLSQYNEIFKALIENKDLQIIKEMIK